MAYMFNGILFRIRKKSSPLQQQGEPWAHCVKQIKPGKYTYFALVSFICGLKKIKIIEAE